MITIQILVHPALEHVPLLYSHAGVYELSQGYCCRWMARAIRVTGKSGWRGTVVVRNARLLERNGRYRQNVRELTDLLLPSIDQLLQAVPGTEEAQE